jgi:dihydrofolate reductase
MEFLSGIDDPEPGERRMSKVALVVAVARNRVIGNEGKLPWRVSGDLQKFKETTLGKPVIMGRKTWESLPKRPLPGRLNIVLTRKSGFQADGAEVVSKAADALNKAASAGSSEICVIGGAEIYQIFWPMASRLYLTEIDATPEGDTMFPYIHEAEWVEVERQPLASKQGDTATATFRVLDRREPKVLQNHTIP